MGLCKRVCSCSSDQIHACVYVCVLSHPLSLSLPSSSLYVVQEESRLCVHALSDGRLLRGLGSHGTGPLQFDLGFSGICFSDHDAGTVLVAEHGNNRVQEASGGGGGGPGAPGQ